MRWWSSASRRMCCGWRRRWCVGGGPQGGEDGEAWRVDGRGCYEDSPALLNALDFVMPPAGGKRGATRCRVRPLRRQSRAFDAARFRYASGGQGAIERWPLASPRSRGASPPLDPQRILRGVPSAAASLRRKAPSGDLPPVTPMRTNLSLSK